MDTQRQVLLSYGMGVESSAILTRWVHEPETRPCPLNQLIAITSQVGDEYEDTGRDVETFILPMIREHQIRYVQVARHGHLEADGITVLEDSRSPRRVFLKGDFKLSDELKLNGTVPQYGGTHRCALKFKAWVIERWLSENIRGSARHAIGYNADEGSRIAKSEHGFAERIAFGFNINEENRVARSMEYNTLSREAFYPLLDWGWSREDCLNYLHQLFGVWWKKSACVYCPFLTLNGAAVDRHKDHPTQVADALMLEHVSLSLNPRGSLYKQTSLASIARASDNRQALQYFEQKLDSATWALYRIRRIFTARGRADRAVEQLVRFGSREAARDTLQRLALHLDCEYEEKDSLAYVWRLRRNETEYPTREELFSVAPATVQTKARYGLVWFEQRWTGQRQMNLFIQPNCGESPDVAQRTEV